MSTPGDNNPLIAPTPPAAPAAGVQENLTCPRCGYNLHGLSGDRITCPECGLLCDRAVLYKYGPARDQLPSYILLGEIPALSTGLILLTPIVAGFVVYAFTLDSMTAWVVLPAIMVTPLTIPLFLCVYHGWAVREMWRAPVGGRLVKLVILKTVLNLVQIMGICLGALALVLGLGTIVEPHLQSLAWFLGLALVAGGIFTATLAGATRVNRQIHNITLAWHLEHLPPRRPA